MKRAKIVSIMLLLFAGVCVAQEPVTLNVTYEFVYVRDLERKNTPYTSNMILSLGRQTSRYCSEKLFRENDKAAQGQKKRQQEVQNMPSGSLVTVSGGPLLIVNRHGAIINEEIVKNVPAQKMTMNAVLGTKSYEIETALPKIDWAIQADKKTIGNYACQKAAGTYAGRTYEVWFAPDLPFQDGPWKLSGLPGLILEARDTKNEVAFVFKTMGRNTDPEETTKSFLSRGYSIKTNLKSYNRARAAFETDPEAVMSAMAPNARLAVMNIDDPDMQHAIKVKKYNPLELD